MSDNSMGRFSLAFATAPVVYGVDTDDPLADPPLPRNPPGTPTSDSQSELQQGTCIGICGHAIPEDRGERFISLCDACIRHVSRELDSHAQSFATITRLPEDQEEDFPDNDPLPDASPIDRLLQAQADARRDLEIHNQAFRLHHIGRHEEGRTATQARLRELSVEIWGFLHPPVSDSSGRESTSPISNQGMTPGRQRSVSFAHSPSSPIDDPRRSRSFRRDSIDYIPGRHAAPHGSSWLDTSFLHATASNRFAPRWMFRNVDSDGDESMSDDEDSGSEESDDGDGEDEEWIMVPTSDEINAEMYPHIPMPIQVCDHDTLKEQLREAMETPLQRDPDLLHSSGEGTHVPKPIMICNHDTLEAELLEAMETNLLYDPDLPHSPRQGSCPVKDFDGDMTMSDADDSDEWSDVDDSDTDEDDEGWVLVPTAAEIEAELNPPPPMPIMVCDHDTLENQLCEALETDLLRYMEGGMFPMDDFN